MVYEVVWQILYSSWAQVLQELEGDIEDITQVFTWDPSGAFTGMVTDQRVGGSELLHCIPDEDWYIVELLPPHDIRGVCSMAGVRYSVL